MKSFSVIAALLFGALLGFSGGRLTAPPPAPADGGARALAPTPAHAQPQATSVGAPRPAPAAGDALARGEGAEESGGVTDVGTAAPAEASAPRVASRLRDAGTGAPCELALEVAENNLAVLESRRKDLEGDPIPARDDVAPRFASAGLVRTFDDAFRATKIKGGVETVDCGEFPCIVFGRLSGDEAMVAELEDSKFFAQYDDDVGVMLTWASGDHEREGGPKEGLEREKPPEISLFAFAFYGHDDKRKHGEALDRRIRTRTAEYWNASRPDE